MNVFKKNIIPITVIVGIILILIFSYTYSRSKRSNAENGAQISMNFVQQFFYKVGDSTDKFVSFLTSYRSMREELEAYKAELVDAERNNKNFYKLQEENERIKAAGKFQTNNEILSDRYTFMGANVIGTEPNNVFTLSRGLEDGIEIGNVVVAYATKTDGDEKIEIGLVGKIISTGKNFSKVQTILDPNLTVAAMVENIGESVGALKGYYSINDNQMTQFFYPIEYKDIKIEDILITSGDGFIYPKGIKIGRIKNITEDKTTLSQVALVKPFVDFNNVNEVVIITINEGVESYEGGEIQ